MLTSAMICGIIPTRMGTRLFKARKTLKSRDHPHAYGDKRNNRKYYKGCSGSSPRVWGQDKFPMTEYLEEGIIPTRMGTSVHLAIFCKWNWDHPHAYGDKDF